MAKLRIALFGGSFDPVHTDHVNIMKVCHDKLKFDKVWVVPAYVNPFKAVSSSSVGQRMEMLNIATIDLDYVEIKTYEISKEKKSYTFDTVEHFQRHYPDYEFSFIMGSDQLDKFEMWNHFEDLIKVIDFKVFIRDENYNKEIVKKYNMETFEFENNYLSSTDIRNLKKLDLQIKEVNDYINNNLMYIRQRVEQKMDVKRFLHSLNVGQMALMLAKLNNVDLNKALIAGTLHDIAKRWTEDELKNYLEKYRPDLLKEPIPVWHSYVGALHLEYDWLFSDKEVIEAVFKHTVGSINMSTLDMIVFCADKISSERDYPEVEYFRTLVKSDLKKGFIELLKNQYEVAVKKHSINSIGKELKQAYDFWVIGEEYNEV